MREHQPVFAFVQALIGLEIGLVLAGACTTGRRCGYRRARSGATACGWRLISASTLRPESKTSSTISKPSSALAFSIQMAQAVHANFARLLVDAGNTTTCAPRCDRSAARLNSKYSCTAIPTGVPPRQMPTINCG